MSSTTGGETAGNAGGTRASLLFPLIGLVAFVTVLLPGPARPAWFIGALALAVANTVVQRTVRWSSLPSWLSIIPLLVATATIGMLVYSAGPGSGLSPLFLLPALTAALTGTPRGSAVVTVASVGALALVAELNGSTGVSIGRSSFFWLAMLTVVSVAMHSLRAGLTRSAERAEEQFRESQVTANAAQALTVLRDADEVIATSVRLAAELASPPNIARRALYFSIHAGRATIVADSDEAGVSGEGVDMAIEDHSVIRRVVATGAAINGGVDLDACSAEVRSIAKRFGVTHGAYVPLRVDDSLTGILCVVGRGVEISESLFQRVKTISALTELALGLAVAHERLVEEAGTDPLTGVANRREFERAMARRPSRFNYAILAIDVDDLKTVNDTHGHPAGDTLIVSVATSIRSALRRGDIVARVGGDEFAVLAIAVEPHEAGELGQRIRRAVGAAPLATGAPRISLGVCAADADADPEQVWSLADVAMYEAKRSGGDRIVVGPALRAARPPSLAMHELPAAQTA
ncbi:MAG: sensor domain-containing diguanylate cyclase [Candidatus Dormibacteraeota bacterium]|nr:sensor domain-containing diguanylate cyclase [Candidatus Dormibacteraeota bacterium]